MSTESLLKGGIKEFTFADYVAVKDDLDMEIEQLSNRLCDVNRERLKYGRDLENISKLKTGMEDAAMLVPLTESMFAYGVLKEISPLIVDLGAGYLAEMSHENASTFLKRKIQHSKDELKRIQAVSQDKISLRDALTSKIMERVRSGEEKFPEERFEV